MTALAEELRFEEAQEIKIKYDLIENIELKAKSYHLCFIILMCSTSKAKKRWHSSTTYMLQMVASIKPLLLNIKRSSMKPTKSCSHWVLSKCVSAMTVNLKKLWFRFT